MADVMTDYEQCLEVVRAAGQEHVFRWWDELDERGRRKLLHQVRSVDFAELSSLMSRYLGRVPEKFAGRLEPMEVVSLPRTPEQQAQWRQMGELGEAAIRRGEVGLFIVAGGQGTRLRYDPPKGTFPICPISGKSLFHVFAEKLLATSARYKRRVPLYVMTSGINNAATNEFFRINHFFGIGRRNVIFAMQDMLPAVDFAGNILLKAKDALSMSPTGHGASIKALKDSGALDDMRRRGIKHLCYHQVDNVLVKSIDPVFLGFHIAAGAEMSLKVLRKRDAAEKLGVVGIVDGRTRVVEYSDLCDELMYATNPDGSLVHATGSIAIHILDTDFIERENEGGFRLPYHVARKVVPFINDSGELVKPQEPNGIKFETFVFDALPDARRSVVLETPREEEFAPVKNATGEDSPATARRALVNLYGRWLHEAGVEVPLDADGNVAGLIEISPLFALDAQELAAKIDRALKFDGKLLLEPPQLPKTE